ncbi:MAG: type II toxin-antitoxin system RelE/ParE family toxin [Planctomycetaceae bacterium]|nr:type II toxin-antitoxin system RelE/ParE family toxin [Planctomycetaceae bacterium]
MGRILHTASALRDIDAIWDCIAIENQHPAAADGLIDEIDDALQLLVARPQIGEVVDYLRPETRRWIVHKNYLLFYDIVGADIRLLRVLHAARLIGPDDLQV